MTVSPMSEIEVENGNDLAFEVEIMDQAGNITTQPRLGVTCKVQHCTGKHTAVAESHSLCQDWAS